jgi:hypothetical protein
MRPPRWISTSIVLLLLSGIVGLRGHPAYGSGLSFPTGALVTGDQTAWREITAAASKQRTLSYREKDSDGTTVEYSPPDSIHTVTQRIEEIVVGQARRYRYRTNAGGAPGKWLCDSAPPSGPDTGKLLSELHLSYAASREADTTIDGTPVHAYSIIVSLGVGGPGIASKYTFYIDSRTGLPRRWVGPASLGNPVPEIVSDVYDYGAPITITLPACGTS